MNKHWIFCEKSPKITSSLLVFIPKLRDNLIRDIWALTVYRLALTILGYAIR